MAESEYKPIDAAQLAGGIRLDTISEMGSSVPPGRYKMRLSRVEAKDSTKGNPMVVAGFDVIDGTPAADKEGKTPDIESIKGLEASAFFSMYVGKSEKSGRIIAPGIMDFKSAAAAVGRPLADDAIFPGNAKDAARLIHDTFHPKNIGEVEVVIYLEPDRNDATKTRSKVKIIGRWGASGAVDVPGASSSSMAIV